MATKLKNPQPPAGADAPAYDQLRRRLDDLRERLDAQAQRHARLEAMVRMGQWEWVPETGAWWHSAGLRALLGWPLNRSLDLDALCGQLEDQAQAALHDAGRALREAAGTWEARITLRDWPGHAMTVDWRMESTPADNGQLVLRGVLLQRAPESVAVPEHRWPGSPIPPAMLHSLIEAIPHPLAVRDPCGNYLKVNHPMAALFGLEPAQMEGRNIRVLLADHPALLAVNLAEDEQVLRTREIFRVEAVPVAAPNGQHIFQNKLKFPVTAPDGTVVGVVALCEDVTARVQATTALEASRRFLRDVFDAIPHPCAVRDTEGRFLMANAPMARWYSLSVEDMEGCDIRGMAWTDQATLDRVLAEDRQVIETGQPLRVTGIEATLPHGHILDLNQVKFPVSAPDGRVIGVGVVCEDVTEQVRTVRDLEQTRGLLEAVFNVVPVAINVTGADGRYLMANQVAARFAGWSVEEMTGRTVRDAPKISDALKAEVERINRELLDGRLTEVSGEHQTLRGDAQTPFHFYRHLAALQDHAGKPYAVVTAYVDITEQRRREQQLRRSETRFHGIFDNAGFGILVTNLQREILLANPAMHRIAGHAPGTLVGKALSEITHPDDVALTMDKVEQIRRGGRQPYEEYEKRLVTPVGETVWARCRVSALHDEQGAVDSVFAIVEDITAQRRREQELRLSWARFHSIFDHASMGIVVTSLDGTILMANPAMGRMIDYDPTDLIGRTIESITHPRDVQRYAMSLENAQQLPDGAQRVIEKRYLTPGGRIVWARVTITAVTDDGGQPDFVVGIVEDITREHERSRSLRNAPGPDIVAPRTPASPTGQLARDFEAMLARIAGAAGDLLREAPGQGRVHDRLTEIIRAAADGAALVQRLLAAPAGDTPPVGPMDLRDICERLVAGLAGELPTGIHLELRLDAETGSCRGDAEMVAQALRNLVTNAVDAMPDGGTVTLSLDKVSPGPAFYASHPKLALGKYFRLRVADTGRGIPATALARVFDPFFTSHRRQDRLGLGLAMVRSAVKRHAGAVTAESIEGQGTTVSLFLPAMADGTWSDAVWGHGALPMPPAGQAVLLVAEDAGLRERVRADLTPQGVPLLAAGNDADAVLDLLGAGHSVALVLMHDAMRGIDQGAVYAQIKRSAPGLPVLFIADGDEATVVVSHVADPGAPRETLAGAVRRLLGR